jgi:hypothetical protein
VAKKGKNVNDWFFFKIPLLRFAAFHFLHCLSFAKHFPLPVFQFRCDQLVNLSELGHVHSLDLKSCGELRDVGALGHVHTLDLSWCNQLVDVSALGHVHTLELMGVCLWARHY